MRAGRQRCGLLNHACFQEGQHIPWESGITAVTPLNRNRWNLNIEATLSFQKQRRAQLRIFISQHQWKGGQPTEKESSITAMTAAYPCRRYLCSFLACRLSCFWHHPNGCTCQFCGG